MARSWDVPKHQDPHDAEPPPTSEDVDAAALQFIRKISGYRAPSRRNQEVFDRAVAEVADATRRLLTELAPAGSR